MAYGDIGGVMPHLIITCTAKGAIKKGYAVTLSCAGAYTVTTAQEGFPVFGMANADAQDGENLPVIVRGVVNFRTGVSRSTPCLLGYGVIGGSGGSVYATQEFKDRRRPVGTVLMQYTTGTVDVLL